MEVSADDIPNRLKLASAVDRMEYDRISIGSSQFLLPRGAEMDITDSSGGESQNRVRLKACHEFVGESALSFENLPAENFVAPVRPTLAKLTLPDDFSMELGLDTPIDSASSAVGDAFGAVLRQNVLAESGLVLPKGTRVSGHIARLEKVGALYYVGLSPRFAQLGTRPCGAE